MMNCVVGAGCLLYRALTVPQSSKKFCLRMKRLKTMNVCISTISDSDYRWLTIVGTSPQTFAFMLAILSAIAVPGTAAGNPISKF